MRPFKGYKTIFDEESKKKVLRGVTASVFPPKPVLDFSLLPPLDLSIAQVSIALLWIRLFELISLPHIICAAFKFKFKPGNYYLDEDKQSQAHAAVSFSLERMQSQRRPSSSTCM